MILSQIGDQYVIYHNPKDYPEKYVVRRWTPHAPEPIPHEAFVGESLEAVRSVIPDGYVHLSPMPGDDPAIVEVWI